MIQCCAVFHEKNYLLFLMTFDCMSLDLFIRPIFYQWIRIITNSIQITLLRSYDKIAKRKNEKYIYLLYYRIIIYCFDNAIVISHV